MQKTLHEKAALVLQAAAIEADHQGLAFVNGPSNQAAAIGPVPSIYPTQGVDRATILFGLIEA